MANYLASNKIKMFPAGNRAESIDPNSKLMTEENLTLIRRSLYQKESFVISWDGSNMTFVIHGYYFSAEGLDSTFDVTGDLFAYICLSTVEQDYNKLQYIGTGTPQGNNIDDGDHFGGIYFNTTDTHPDTPTGNWIKLQLLADGQVPSTSKLHWTTDEILNSGSDIPISSEFGTSIIYGLNTITHRASEGQVDTLQILGFSSITFSGEDQGPTDIYGVNNLSVASLYAAESSIYLNASYINFSGSIMPASNDSYDIGLSLNSFRSLYVKDVYARDVYGFTLQGTIMPGTNANIGLMSGNAHFPVDYIATNAGFVENNLFIGSFWNSSSATIDYKLQLSSAAVSISTSYFSLFTVGNPVGISLYAAGTGSIPGGSIYLNADRDIRLTATSNVYIGAGYGSIYLNANSVTLNPSTKIELYPSSIDYTTAKARSIYLDVPVTLKNMAPGKGNLKGLTQNIYASEPYIVYRAVTSGMNFSSNNPTSKGYAVDTSANLYTNFIQVGGVFNLAMRFDCGTGVNISGSTWYRFNIAKILSEYYSTSLTAPVHMVITAQPLYSSEAWGEGFCRVYNEPWDSNLSSYVYIGTCNTSGPLKAMYITINGTV